VKVKCIKNHESLGGRLEGLKIDTYYQLTDIDTIGYRIIDELGRNLWYIKANFEPIEDTRDKKINQLINNF
jgi:hypothetical protein